MTVLAKASSSLTKEPTDKRVSLESVFGERILGAVNIWFALKNLHA
jgi:hypothetical protein